MAVFLVKTLGAAPQYRAACAARTPIAALTGINPFPVHLCRSIYRRGGNQWDLTHVPFLAAQQFLTASPAAAEACPRPLPGASYLRELAASFSSATIRMLRRPIGTSGPPTTFRLAKQPSSEGAAQDSARKDFKQVVDDFQWRGMTVLTRRAATELIAILSNC